MVTNNWKSSDDCVANVGEFKLNKNKRKNKNEWILGNLLIFLEENIMVGWRREYFKIK